MLHRLVLRVLPRLTLAVTETAVRKRKRLVMVVPGLVAFGMYRLTKQFAPLVDPVPLLCLSGIFSAFTALAAFRFGRQIGFVQIWREDGGRRLGWIAGWIGFIYGIQLSLLVLALLKVLVQYDFFRHPDGPAMMSIIIACTSVARDAFEIGHVRWLQASGRPVLTFPDGKPLRDLFHKRPVQVMQWATIGGVLTASIAGALSMLGEWERDPLSQLVAITLTGGVIALWSYLVGVHQTEIFAAPWARHRFSELFRFLWWPGLAFAATYYLVAVGILTFLLHMDKLHAVGNVLVACTVGALMGMYGYYLGCRRHHEDRELEVVPASLLRCPFVAGILTRSGRDKVSGPLTSSSIALGESGRQG